MSSELVFAVEDFILSVQVFLYWLLACWECRSNLAIFLVVQSWLLIFGGDTHRDGLARYQPSLHHITSSIELPLRRTRCIAFIPKIFPTLPTQT